MVSSKANQSSKCWPNKQANRQAYRQPIKVCHGHYDIYRHCTWLHQHIVCSANCATRLSWTGSSKILISPKLFGQNISGESFYHIKFSSHQSPLTQDKSHNQPENCKSSRGNSISSKNISRQALQPASNSDTIISQRSKDLHLQIWALDVDV